VIFMKLSLKVLFVAISILIFFLIDRHQSAVFEEKQQFELVKEADLAQLRIQNAVNQRIKCPGYLKSLMELHPDTRPEEFAVFAEKMMALNPSIRALQIADSETRVIYVYPPKGNEVTIQEPMVLIDDPDRGEYVKKAIEQHRLIVQPPFELRQGGLGIVARDPFYIDGIFSGMAIAVLDVSEILNDELIQTDLSMFSLSLSDSNGLEFFSSSSEHGVSEKRIILVADSFWEVFISSIGPGSRIPVFQRVAEGLGVAGVMLIIYLVMQLLLRRAGLLKDEVRKKAAELSENEKKLIAVIENTGAGYFKIDSDGIYRDVNKSWLEMHGYRSKDEIIGKHFTLTLTETDLPYAEQKFEKLLNSRDVSNGEFTRVKKDGSFGYHTYTVRTLSKNGGIHGLEGFLFDITDRIESERAKDLLMRELNHRVKNNLMIVSSLLKIKDNSLGEAADLSDISNQIDAVQLLHEKLNKTGEVSRIGARDYLEDLLQTIFSTLIQSEVELRFEIEDVYFNVKTAVAIGLIVNELSTNAVKYGFQDEEVLWFGLSLKLTEDGTQFVLILTNSGKPIPEHVTLDNPETFGLRLVSTLVKQLGGSIELQKYPETAFTVYIPEATASGMRYTL